MKYFFDFGFFFFIIVDALFPTGSFVRHALLRSFYDSFI